MTRQFQQHGVENRLHRVAVVTGAARRIGRRIALALAEDGFAVVVHFGKSAAAAEELVAQIQQTGGIAMAVGCDLADAAKSAEKIMDAASAIGCPQLLINNASVFEDLPLADVTMQHCLSQLGVNLVAPVFLSQQFVSRLPDGIPGQIINILDWRAARPPADHLIYTASKAALASVTSGLAQQLAPQIRVNGVAPGAVLAPPGREQWHQQRADREIPLRVSGSPENITSTIRFLIHNTFITGEVITLSGGEHL